MNKICHYLESELEEIKKPSQRVFKEDDSNGTKSIVDCLRTKPIIEDIDVNGINSEDIEVVEDDSNENISNTESTVISNTESTVKVKLNTMKSIVDQFFNQKKKFRKGLEKDYVDIDQYIKLLRRQAYDVFDSAEEIANYAVEVCYVQKYHQSKSAAWQIFGEELIGNMLKNNNYKAQLPVEVEMNQVEMNQVEMSSNDTEVVTYLFKNYIMKDFVIPVIEATEAENTAVTEAEDTAVTEAENTAVETEVEKI